MSNAKKVVYAMTAGFAAGAIFGILYAPDKGSKTRRKMERLKRKITFCDDGIDDELEKLEELSDALQDQLVKVTKKLEEV